MLIIPRVGGMVGSMGGHSSSSNEGSKRSKAVELEYDHSYYGYYDYLFEKGSSEGEVWFKIKPKKDYEARILITDLEYEYTVSVYDGRKEIGNVPCSAS